MSGQIDFREVQRGRDKSVISGHVEMDVVTRYM
jgi:hypothetical protein